MKSTIMISNYAPIAFVVIIFTTVTIAIFSIVNSVVILPYMDEIFHIPQAQKYCQGNFTHWDGKITTPPGLYIYSLCFNKLFQVLIPNVWDCGVCFLRGSNVVLALGNLFVFYAITRTLNGNKKKNASLLHSALTSLNVAVFPVLYFFTFLYYTDTGSTFCTLLAYLLALRRRHTVAAGVVAVALLFRQTNIVWAAFFGMLALIEVLERHAAKELKKVNRCSTAFLKVTIFAVYNLVLNKRNQGYKKFIYDVAVTCGGYVLVGLGFLLFLIWNGGIVLGDRTAHRAVVHIPQLLYFLAFTLFFASPFLLSPRYLRQFLAVAKRHWITTCFIALSTALIILFNTMAHPYLLADNRHYPFYLWRKLLTPYPLAKYLPIPLYMYSLLTIYELLKSHQGILWTTGYFLTIALSLIPQELLEFRYFILPYIMFRLSLPLKDTRSLVLEFLIYFAVNFVTIYMFIMKPFVMAESDFLQRFMW